VGLAGLSTGGYLAFECLKQWPEKIRAAAFLDSTAFADEPDGIFEGQEMAQVIRDGRFEEVLDSYVSSALSPANGRGGPLRDLVKRMALELGPETFLAGLEAILKRGSYADVLPLLRVPVLFVSGELDTLTPPEVSRRMAAEVPGASLKLISGAGHLSPLENPDQVAEALGAFFEASLRM
jgi:pimeloyl-ACP methyl ester carboxylesterase